MSGFNSQNVYAINTSGGMIGTLNYNGVLNHAFIDTGSGIVDLNNLIGTTSGWTLNTAQDFNDLGQIVGQGTDPSGNVRGYILTPVRIPEPSTVILTVSATGAGLLRRRRRRLQIGC